MARKHIQNIYNNFADAAKTLLDKITKKYKEELIKKAYDIKCEESEKSDNMITVSHVLRAEKILRIKKKKINYLQLIVSILVDVLSVIIGFLFDVDKFTDTNYVLIFLALAVLWIALVMVKYLKGDG